MALWKMFPGLGGDVNKKIFRIYDISAFFEVPNLSRYSSTGNQLSPGITGDGVLYPVV